MKKYMVRTDIEGVSGVVSYEQSVPGNDEYAEGRELFMGDLLALLQGLFEGGADEVYLYDEHCAGRNIRLEQLPPHVYTYMGKPMYKEDWAGGLDDSFSGLILLGFHSKADNPGYLLNHSYESDIRNISVNGISMGEIGVETAIAGELGVPLVMITADSEGVKEAKELAPDTAGVVVKESCSEYGALCYPACETRDWIRTWACEVAKGSVPIPKPYQVTGPVEMRIDFFPGEYAQRYQKVFGEAVFHGDSVLSCWAQYQEKKARV
ncbi:MAG: M55 family metallopeptidase [Lachnospiraceae bacterium]|nr:M55 family metallopeptidase [Lachnospiraceae bacterium]